MESNGCAKEDTQEQGLRVKPREVKGIEASHAIKCSNTTVKIKMDQHKEAMLGKKRNRQTVFLNLEDVKQASPINTSTPRRQNFVQPVVTRSRAVNPPDEHGGEILSHGFCRDQKPIDVPSHGGIHPESAEQKSESNGESYSGLLGKPRRLNGDEGPSAERVGTSLSRQASSKQPTNLRQHKSGHSSSRKVSSSQSSFKKPAKTSTQYQDTSVERLIREVTNEKFWHHPGMLNITLRPMEHVLEYAFFSMKFCGRLVLVLFLASL